MTLDQSTHLGRGGSRLIFEEGIVRKFQRSHLEPITMKAFPQVFCPILSIEDEYFTMPRLLPSSVEHRRTALMAGADKLRHLWRVKRTTNDSSWRSKLYLHLQRITKNHPHHVPKTAADIVRSIPEPDQYVYIHGDATLANLITNANDEWFWIDPLEREFIPGDPHVDLGKMLQSCMGYEQVLLGEKPACDRELGKQLARHCNLSMPIALKWLTVHIIRLIPYQEPHVQKYYGDVLKGMNL